MMATATVNLRIVTKVKERSEITFQMTFAQGDGSALVPKDIKWSLSTDDGTIVNSRRDEDIATPAAVVNVKLWGDDTALIDGIESVTRAFTIRALYDDAPDIDIEVNNEILFDIDEIINVPTPPVP